MKNLVLLFALLCFQLSRGEGVSDTDALHSAAAEEKEEQVIQFPGKVGDSLEESNEEKSAEDDWTEEDEKWFEEIQNLLSEDSDEDYVISDAEFGKLIQQIEKLMSEHHPEKGDYEWLGEIAKWFMGDEDDYEDDMEDEVDEGLAGFYSWIYQKNTESGKKSKRPLQKRFSSV